MTRAAKVQQNATLTVNGKVADLSKALPLTLRDWRTLEDLGVTDERGELNAVGPRKMVALMTHVLGKANPDITEADVLEYPMTGLSAFAEVVQRHMGDGKERAETRPT